MHIFYWHSMLWKKMHHLEFTWDLRLGCFDKTIWTEVASNDKVTFVKYCYVCAHKSQVFCRRSLPKWWNKFNCNKFCTTYFSHTKEDELLMINRVIEGIIKNTLESSIVCVAVITKMISVFLLCLDLGHHWSSIKVIWKRGRMGTKMWIWGRVMSNADVIHTCIYFSTASP